MYTKKIKAHYTSEILFIWNSLEMDNAFIRVNYVRCLTSEESSTCAVMCRNGSKM
jgi:hypothetical protein